MKPRVSAGIERKPSNYRRTRPHSAIFFPAKLYIVTSDQHRTPHIRRPVLIERSVLRVGGRMAIPCSVVAPPPATSTKHLHQLRESYLLSNLSSKGPSGSFTSIAMPVYPPSVLWYLFMSMGFAYLTPPLNSHQLKGRRCMPILRHVGMASHPCLLFWKRQTRETQKWDENLIFCR